MEFTIGIDDLKYYTNDLQHLAEKGTFEAMVGGDSDKVKKAGFELKKAYFSFLKTPSFILEAGCFFFEKLTQKILIATNSRMKHELFF